MPAWGGCWATLEVAEIWIGGAYKVCEFGRPDEVDDLALSNDQRREALPE